jgi:tetratricopeptide (TPR) repeat protein
MKVFLDREQWSRPARYIGINGFLSICFLIWSGHAFGLEEIPPKQTIISTPSLLTSDPPAESTQLQEFRAQLEEAITKKREKNFSAAEIILTLLLKDSTPPEIQQAALLEMAVIADEANDLSKALQIYGEFLKKFPEDAGASEILLRQGLICRKMGANVLALSKFYAVLSTALRLRPDRLEHYQRLVIQAQTEIAETYYLQGKYKEAVDFLGRLLKLDATEKQKVQITHKLVQSLSALGRFAEVAAKAQLFIEQYPDASQIAEIRFLLADAFKKLGRDREAVQEVMILLEGQERAAERNPGGWTYWRQRAGNEIANQLYSIGDYINALAIYKSLAALDVSPEWRVPVWYQIGLVYERLQQPPKARENYENILAATKDVSTSSTNSSLAVVREMAAWRKDHLTWLMQAEKSNDELTGLDSTQTSMASNDSSSSNR